MTSVEAAVPAVDPAAIAALSERIERLLVRVEQLAAARGTGEDAAPLPAEAIQALLAQAITLYAGRVRSGAMLPRSASASEAVTATEAMIATIGLLRAIDLDLFEFILWSGPA